MLKELFYYRKISVGFMLLLFMGISLISGLTSFDFWHSPFGTLVNNFFDIIVWIVLTFGLWAYCDNYRDIKIKIWDDIYETNIVFYKSFFYATVFFALNIGIYLIVNYAGYKLNLFLIPMCVMFLAAPIFWLKVIWNLNVWIINKIIPSFLTYKAVSNINKNTRNGNWGIGRAVAEIIAVDVVIEALHIQTNFNGLLEPQDKVEIPVFFPSDGNGIDTLIALEEKYKKWIHAIVGIVFSIFLIIGCINSFNTMRVINTAENKAFLTQLQKFDDIDNNADWEYICTVDGKTEYYLDKNTLALDNNTNIVNVVIKRADGKDKKGYYLFDFQYPVSVNQFAYVDINMEGEKVEEDYYKTKNIPKGSPVDVIYQHIGTKLHLTDVSKSKVSFEQGMLNKLNRETKNEVIAKKTQYADYTGADRKLEVGTKCILNANNVTFNNITNNIHRTFNASDNERLATIFTIKLVNEYPFNAKATLVKTVKGIDEQDGKDVEIKFAVGDEIIVNHRSLSRTEGITDDYFCSLKKDGKSYGMVLKQDYFKISPEQQAYSYIVSSDNSNFNNMVVEGKYLTPITE